MSKLSNFEIGAPITAQFPGGEKVDGWYYGELPLGTLISMNWEGTDIRLIPKEAEGAFRRPAKAGAKFAVRTDLRSKLTAIGQSIEARMDHALKELDVKPIQDAVIRVRELKSELRSHKDPRPDSIDSDLAEDLVGYLAARTDEVIGLHKSVYEELDRVKIIDIVEEASEQLPEVSGRFLLPIADEKKVAGSFLRYVSASLRILTGTSLSAANVGIGLAGGLSLSVVTLGATAIPTYVAMATSILMGLVQVEDGLDKIGLVQKDEQGA